MGISAASTVAIQPHFILFCSLLGALSLLKISISILRFIYIYFIRSRNNIKKYGQWAIITGPTDGIGKAVAFELARQQIHLVLVGRNADKLHQVSSEIKAEVLDVELKTVVIDFAADISDGIIKLEETIKDIDVGILVNNAGLSQIIPTFFHETEEETWETLVKVNLVAPTVMTSSVLPYILKRRSGAIINVGSGSTVVIPSFPLYAVYTGTKGYISKLSMSLHHEYKRSGIDIQCQLPSFVVTKITPGLKSSFFIATPSEYARSAIRCIGCESELIPYWPHYLQGFIFRLCPDWLLDKLIFQHVLELRKAALSRKRKGPKHCLNDTKKLQSSEQDLPS